MGECSNNTNKLSPQEPVILSAGMNASSNNTNKLSPQELVVSQKSSSFSSNNTNKLSPQEPYSAMYETCFVQIIQINLVLKNHWP